ncbi:MAG TPA: MFS transporter [Thermomicrobiales bacterium]|nr:MFS transporter [Thermomicrobiales bacterium]
MSASSRTDLATPSAASGPAIAAGPEAYPAERTVLVAVALGTMLAPLNSTMIVVALPAILDDFNRPLAWGSWIVVSYLVAMAAIQPLGGSLGDRYGRRRMFAAGLAGFLLASLGAALAPTIETLIVARTIQALAGATAIPNGVALVRANLPPGRQGRAFGMIGSGIAIAAAAGPPLGGVISESLGWRWIFAVNIVLVVPALTLALRLAADRPERKGRFELAGGVLLLVGLVSLALSLTIWRLDGVPLVVAPLLAALAAAALVVLVRRAGRHPAPALNPALFRRPGFTPATLTVLFSNMAMYTVLLSLPIYLDKRAGWSGMEIGLLLAGLSIQMVIFSPIGGRLSDRRGRRYPALLGTALIAAGVAPLIALDVGWSWLMLLVPLVVLGIGVGLSAAPVQAAAVNAAAAAEAGQAAGLFSTMRYLGSILGSAGLAAILSDPPLENDFRILYAGLTIAALLAVAAAARLP